MHLAMSFVCRSVALAVVAVFRLHRVAKGALGGGGVVSGKGALRRPEAFVRPARDDRRSATFDRSESKQKKRLKRAGVVECRKEPRVTFCGFRGCVFVHDYYY